MIYDMFHVLPLEQDTTRKKEVEISIELNISNSKENEVEVIYNSKFYAQESDNGHLLDLYYLFS